MLRAVGFAHVDVISPVRSMPYRALRAVYHKAQDSSLRSAFRQDRTVFHAFK
jgi:hypothetical protein